MGIRMVRVKPFFIKAGIASLIIVMFIFSGCINHIDPESFSAPGEAVVGQQIDIVVEFSTVTDNDDMGDFHIYIQLPDLWNVISTTPEAMWDTNDNGLHDDTWEVGLTLDDGGASTGYVAAEPGHTVWAYDYDMTTGTDSVFGRVTFTVQVLSGPGTYYVKWAAGTRTGGFGGDHVYTPSYMNTPYSFDQIPYTDTMHCRAVNVHKQNFLTISFNDNTCRQMVQTPFWMNVTIPNKALVYLADVDIIPLFGDQPVDCNITVGTKSMINPTSPMTLQWDADFTTLVQDYLKANPKTGGTITIPIKINATNDPMDVMVTNMRIMYDNFFDVQVDNDTPLVYTGDTLKLNASAEEWNGTTYTNLNTTYVTVDLLANNHTIVNNATMTWNAAGKNWTYTYNVDYATPSGQILAVVHIMDNNGIKNFNYTWYTHIKLLDNASVNSGTIYEYGKVIVPYASTCAFNNMNWVFGPGATLNVIGNLTMKNVNGKMDGFIALDIDITDSLVIENSTMPRIGYFNNDGSFITRSTDLNFTRVATSDDARMKLYGGTIVFDKPMGWLDTTNGELLIDGAAIRTMRNDGVVYGEQEGATIVGIGTDITLHNNTIYTGGDGFLAGNGAKLTITWNEFNSFSGITYLNHIGTNTEPVEICNNTVNGGGLGFLYADETAVGSQINDNVITGVGTAFFITDVRGTNFTHNYIESTVAGISLTDSSWVNITENKIISTDTVELTTSAANVLVKNNSLSGGINDDLGATWDHNYYSDYAGYGTSTAVYKNIWGTDYFEGGTPAYTVAGIAGSIDTTPLTCILVGGQTYGTIQAAVDASSHGDTIEIPNGTFIEDVLINAAHGNHPLTLTGQGNNTIVRATGTGQYAFTVTGSATITHVNFTNFKIDTHRGIEFQNIFVEARATNMVMEGDYCLHFNNAENVVINNSYFSNLNRAMFSLSTLNNVNFNNNYMNGGRISYLDGPAADSFVDLSINNNTFVSSSVDQILDSTGLSIVDNTFDNTWDNVIFVQYSTDGDILRNTLTNLGNDAIYVRYSDNFRINENTIDDVDEGLYIRDSDHFFIHNNTISNSDDAMWIRNTDDCDVKNNYINESTTGIDLADSNTNIFKNNTIEDCDGGVYTDNSDNNEFAWFDINTITNTGFYDDGGNGNILHNSTIDDCDDGVLFQSSPIYIFTNEISSCSSGIIDGGGPSTVEIAKNEIHNNTVGIALDTSANAFIDRNDVHDNTDAGIYIDAIDGVWVTNNTCDFNDIGFILEDLDFATFSNNTANNNTEGGIMFDTCQLFSADNIVANDNGEYGVAGRFCYYVGFIGGIFERNGWVENIPFGVGGAFVASTECGFINCTAIDTIGHSYFSGAVDQFALLLCNSINPDLHGLLVDSSTDMYVSNSDLYRGGIFIQGDQLNEWDHDILNSNLNNKPIYNYYQASDLDVPDDAGQVILANCTNMIVDNLDLSDVSIGVLLGFSDNNTINLSTMDEAMLGIHAYGSGMNDIHDNNFNGAGMRADTNAITLLESYNNTIETNRITNHRLGMFFNYTTNNTVYNNYFDNTENVEANNSADIWNIAKTAGTSIIGGPNLGGNYWSDYAGVDNDGDWLGDTMLPYGPGDQLPLCYDVVPPVLEDLTTGTPTTGDNFTFIANCTDERVVANVWVEYSFNDGPVMQLDLGNQTGDTFSADIVIASNQTGYINYSIYGRDALNILNTSLISKDVIDNDAPWYVSHDVPVSSPVGLDVMVSIDVDDNIAVDNVDVVFTIPGGSQTTQAATLNAGSWEYTITGIDTVGDLVVSFNYYDAAGNQGSSGPYAIDITDAVKPVISINSPSENELLGGTVKINVTANDLGSGVDHVLVLVGTTELYNSTMFGTFDVDWDTTAGSDGVKTIHLTAFDLAGNVNTTSVQVVVDNTAPTADAGNNKIIYEGDTASFNGSGSFDVNGITSYTWTFEYDGLNETRTTEAFTYTFDKLGNYTITLKVTDPLGHEGSDTLWVRVDEKASSPNTPKVELVTPAEDSKNIPVDTTVVIKFSLPMDTASIEGVLNMPGTYTTNWSSQNKILTITFDSDLDYETEYTVGVGVGKGANGEASLAYVWSFTTEKDGVAPPPPEDAVLTIDSPKDGQVYDVGQVIPISGTSENLEGKTITIEVDGETFTVVIGSDGKWSTTIELPDAEGTYQIKVSYSTLETTVDVEIKEGGQPPEPDDDDDDDDSSFSGLSIMLIILAMVLVIIIIGVIVFIVLRKKRDEEEEKPPEDDDEEIEPEEDEDDEKGGPTEADDNEDDDEKDTHRKPPGMEEDDIDTPEDELDSPDDEEEIWEASDEDADFLDDPDEDSVGQLDEPDDDDIDFDDMPEMDDLDELDELDE